MTLYPLARIQVPAPDFSEPLLYLRTDRGVLVEEGVRVRLGDRVSFDTSFGAFPVGRWRRLTSVGDVVASLEVDGPCRIDLVSHRNGVDTVIDSTDTEDSVCCPDIARHQADSLYVTVTALADDVVVRGGKWSTSTPAPRDVHLGVAITTFNRQQYVLATIDKLIAIESGVSSVTGHLQVLVVDNASNLVPDIPDDAPVTVLSNPNLGGAGGFARGLIEFRDAGWSTHVVFMDDDISLEPEAILRTISLLTFARSDDLCIHGVMMSEEQPWMQFEAGSAYEFRSVYPLRAHGRGVDLRERAVALEDATEIELDYSAWWFTVFPMHVATDNPLPVFVRGDDVAFGLMHTGRHTVTMPGIAVWHADFALKNNPASLYYEVRNFALIDTLVFDKHSRWHLAWRYLGFGFRNAYSHRYASAEYMIRGMNDFLAGPEAWMRIDHSAKHDELRRTDEEKAVPLEEGLVRLGFTPTKHKAIRLVGFLMSPLLGGGRWLPASLRTRRIGVAQIDVRAVGLAIRHDRILYRHPRFDEGFLCERDSERFARIQREVFSTTWRLLRTYKSLKKAYRRGYREMVSDESWKRRFAGRIDS